MSKSTVNMDPGSDLAPCFRVRLEKTPCPGFENQKIYPHRRHVSVWHIYGITPPPGNERNEKLEFKALTVKCSIFPVSIASQILKWLLISIVNKQVYLFRFKYLKIGRLRPIIWLLPLRALEKS